MAQVSARLVAAVLGCLAIGVSVPARAQSVSVLYSFSGHDGDTPQGPLLALGGSLYGTTRSGGENFSGNVFSLTTSGVETVLHTFAYGSADGYHPNPLTQVGGRLYGTTASDIDNTCSAKVCGTVFSLAPDGSGFTTDYTFIPKVGIHPSSRLLPLNGSLYGTAGRGGAGGYGTLFRYTPGGKTRAIVNFAATGGGAYPHGDLTFSKGAIYGATGYSSPSSDFGVVYEATPQGTKSVLHAFPSSGQDGTDPNGGLLLRGGVLYGTAADGGDLSVRGGTGGGTAFSIAADGTFTLLHTFHDNPDGSNPNGNLVAINGKLYGTTRYGGSAGGCGTVFSLTKAGALTVLASFACSGTGPILPNAGLVVLGGTLYGTTSYGGSAGKGTVFAFTP